MEPRVRKTLAWAVHLFTATGIVAGFLSILAITEHRWQAAAFWLVVGLIIDGVDGTMARAVKVREALPKVSGKNIDYVIDFANYAIIPAYFIYEAGLLPPGFDLAGAIIILLVSVIYYGIEGMVSTDNYFVGFPVLWNLVAFYLFFILILSPWVNFGIIVFLAILHFVPLKFLYPSQVPRFRWLHMSLAALTMGTVLWIIYRYPALDPPARWLAIACMIYFGSHAVWATWGAKRRAQDTGSL